MKKKITIFDSESTGHHLEYVQHIAQYVCENSLPYDVTLVVHPEVAASVRQHVSSPSLSIQGIAPKIISRIETSSSLWRRSLYEWAVARRWAEQSNAQHLVLLTLNWFQLGLVSPRAFQAGFTVSGILFSPYPRWRPTANGGMDRLSNWIKRLRKKGLLWLMMRNPNIASVHILNDPEAAEHLNRAVDPHERFTSLPDPVPSLPKSEKPTSVYDTYSISPNRTLFLFFGTISKRKGIIETLKAMQMLSEQEQRRGALLLLGRLKEGQESPIGEHLRKLQAKSNLEVRTDFRFVAPEELSDALHSADVILAPYQRTEGSSGVIGHAARAHCPVIGPKDGLIGTLIRSYQLGATAEVTQPSLLSQAIAEATEGKVSIVPHLANQYVSERSPYKFASKIVTLE